MKIDNIEMIFQSTMRMKILNGCFDNITKKKIVWNVT